MSPKPDYECAVIGGGPAGSVCATLLAQAGHSVALFERASFPRFHVGESLVPAVNLTLERLGLLEEMDRRGFTQKHGVQFFAPDGTPSKPFYFREVEDPRMHKTWQVLRSEFDQMLVENAMSKGVDVSMDTSVVDVLESDGVIGGVRIRRIDESEEDVRARVVIDSSGQQATLARRFGRREHIDELSNTAIFAHYHDVKRDEGIDAGSTLVYRVDERSWFWFIPLRDAVSIGLVTPARDILRFGRDRGEIFEAAIDRCPALRERLEFAKRATEVMVARDYSYRTTVDGGKGWALIGDALGFIDPVYSTGLLLAVVSADVAAKEVTCRLHGDGVPDLTNYSADYQVGFEQFLNLVRAFYSDDFRFGELSKDPDCRQGLVDLLTGVVGTAEADKVSEIIRGFFDDRVACE